MLMRKYGLIDGDTSAPVGMVLLMLGIGLSGVGVVLNRRTEAGMPLSGELFGAPLDDVVTIGVFVAASVLIGMSIAFNVALLRERRERSNRR